MNVRFATANGCTTGNSSRLVKVCECTLCNGQRPTPARRVTVQGWIVYISENATAARQLCWQSVRVRFKVFLACFRMSDSTCDYMQEVYSAFSQDNRLKELLIKGVQNSKLNHSIKSVGERKENKIIACPDSQCSQHSFNKKSVSSVLQQKKRIRDSGDDFSTPSPKISRKGKTVIKGVNPLPKVKCSSKKIKILKVDLVKTKERVPQSVEQREDHSNKQCVVQATQLSGVGSLDNHSVPGLGVLRNMCENMSLPVRELPRVQVNIPHSSQKVLPHWDDSFEISEDNLRYLDKLVETAGSSKSKLPTVEWDDLFEITEENLVYLDKLVEAAGYPSTSKSHSVPRSQSSDSDAEEYPTASQLLKESNIDRSQEISQTLNTTDDLLGPIIGLPSAQQVQEMENLIDGSGSLVEGAEYSPTEAAGGSTPLEDTRLKINLLNNELERKLRQKKNRCLKFKIIKRKFRKEIMLLNKQISHLKRGIFHL